MSATIDRALWCPRPIRNLFVGADIRTRCDAGHDPRLFNVGDSVWIALCQRGGDGSCGGTSASTLYRIGVDSDLPSAARRLARHDVPAVAESLSIVRPLPDVDPRGLAPSGDVFIATLLRASSWGYLVRGLAPGLVAFVGEKPIAIVACHELGAQMLRRALPKSERHLVPLARERRRVKP